MNRSQIAVLVLAAASFVGTLPKTYGAISFAFGDKGWPLTVDTLLDEGLRPVLDFGYFYGLLTLSVDRAIFAVIGKTPIAVVALDAACALAVAIGLVRSMRATNMTGAPAVFLAVCTPLAVMPNFFPSPAHALEAALLANALAFHLAGRLDRALVLVTLAVLIKPSLGYVYGFLLVVLILAQRSEGAPRWRGLVPATVVGAVVLVGLVVQFGWEAVYRTQVPFDAMRAYRDSGFGLLFGSGREFWRPTDPKPLFHLLTPVGVWLAASVVLVVLAMCLLPRVRQPIPSAVVSCAILHLVFAFVLFGNQWSWIYYPYILFIGTAVGLNALRVRPDGSSNGIVRSVAIALIVLAILGQLLSIWLPQVPSFAENHRTPEAGGMFMNQYQVPDWKAARKLGQSSNVFVLTRMGAVSTMAPELKAPRSWCLIQTLAAPGELDRVREQIRAAEWLIVPNWHDNDLMKWPEFAEVLAPFRLVGEFDDKALYNVYRRVPKAGG